MIAGIRDALLEPVHLVRTYERAHWRPDAMAGITVAVILLPQAIAFALIAELPPEMGIYAAIIGAFFGALWGSSNQVHIGPTNAISLLVLSALLTSADAGTGRFVVAAGMLALMVGVMQFVLGVARLGVLVNFVSHSVIVGFSTGAGVLIAVKQLRPLLGLEIDAHSLPETVWAVGVNLLSSHRPTAAIGLATIVFIIVLRRLNPQLPNALIGMILASAVVAGFGLHEQGVAVIGQLPRGLPPVANLPLLDIALIRELSIGALAVGAIGLVETAAISRSMAAQTGQRLDSNQEFIGQGLANIAVGIFSGYPVAGSFSRSAVNFKAGAQTRMSALFSSVFVLIALFVLGPFAAFLPRTALAGVLIVTAVGMIDQKEIQRIWRGARDDAVIMAATFLATLLVEIEFAVLLGILLSFALYIMKSSVPRVTTVLPDVTFKHFAHQPNAPECVQLTLINISGDLYFGAVTHVEEAILAHMDAHPDQRYMLLRLHQVNQIDFSGIHMLETVVKAYRASGGDVYLTRVNPEPLALMQSTGFADILGDDHFLAEDEAIAELFYHVLDPAICIYECPVRAFRECQNLPKHSAALSLPQQALDAEMAYQHIGPEALWQKVHAGSPLQIVDVREPREYRRSHIPNAVLLPLSRIMTDAATLDPQRPIVLTCRSGRRSERAAAALSAQGFAPITILDGGMRAWEAADLLCAIDDSPMPTQEIPHGTNART